MLVETSGWRRCRYSCALYMAFMPMFMHAGRHSFPVIAEFCNEHNLWYEWSLRDLFFYLQGKVEQRFAYPPPTMSFHRWSNDSVEDRAILAVAKADVNSALPSAVSNVVMNYIGPTWEFDDGARSACFCNGAVSGPAFIFNPFLTTHERAVCTFMCIGDVPTCWCLASKREFCKRKADCELKPSRANKVLKEDGGEFKPALCQSPHF